MLNFIGKINIKYVVVVVLILLMYTESFSKHDTSSLNLGFQILFSTKRKQNILEKHLTIESEKEQYS